MKKKRLFAMLVVAMFFIVNTAYAVELPTTAATLANTVTTAVKSSSSKTEGTTAATKEGLKSLATTVQTAIATSAAKTDAVTGTTKKDPSEVKFELNQPNGGEIVVDDAKLEGGSIKAVEYGTTLKFAVKVNDGYKLDKVTVEGNALTEKNGKFESSIKKNTIIKVELSSVFTQAPGVEAPTEGTTANNKAEEKHNVTFAVNNNAAGQILFGGNVIDSETFKQEIAKDTAFGFTVNAKEGFKVNSVKANGVALNPTSENTYKLEGVMADVNINVDFGVANINDTKNANVTVTFYIGDAIYTSFDVPNGGSLGAMPVPGEDKWPAGVKSFVGWFTEKDGSGEQVNEKTIFNDNKFIYAHFSNEELFNIQFKDIDGKVIYNERKKADDSITAYDSNNLPPVQNKQFDFWVLEGESTAFDFANSKVTGDMTFVPIYKEAIFVFFYSDGTQITPQEVKKGEKAVAPANPTRPGYDFKHWSAAKDSDVAYDFNAPVDNTITLYAVWTPQTVPYTVVIWKEKVNIKGTPSFPNDYDSFKVVKNEQTKAEAGKVLTKDDIKDFLLKEGNDEYHNPYTEARYFEYKDIANPAPILGNGLSVVNVMYNRVEYTMQFSMAGSDHAYNEDEYNQNASNGSYHWPHKPDGTITWKGVGGNQTIDNPSTAIVYTFKAKYEQDISNLWPSMGANANLSGSGKLQPTGWGSNSQTYGGTGTNISQRLTLESDLIPKTGAFDSEYGGPLATSIRWYPIYYPQVRKYQLNYLYEALEGENGEEPNRDIPGGELKTVGNQSIYGKKYVKDNTLSQTLIDSSRSKFTAKNIDGANNVAYTEYTVGAGNEPVGPDGAVRYDFYYNRKTLTLTYNTLGGNDIAQVRNVKHGEKIGLYKPNDPENQGKKFVGWYYDANFKNAVDWDNDRVATNSENNNSETTLFARWESTQHTLTYYANKASVGNAQALDSHGVDSGGYAEQDRFVKITGVDGKTYSLDIGIDVPGYGKFTGWFWTPGGGADFSMSYDMAIYQNYNLYAGWKTDGYKITYDVGGATGTPPVDNGSYSIGTSVTLPSGSGLTMGDKVFAGWLNSIDGKIYYSGTDMPINGDTTLTAQFVDRGTIRTITTEAVNGTIDTTVQNIFPGSTVTINYQPNAKHILDKIIVNGQEISDPQNYPNSYTFASIFQNHSIKVIYKENRADYKVEYYNQLTDGTYSSFPHDTQILNGFVGDIATAVANTPEGFELDNGLSVLTGTIAADGSLVLKVYNKRKEYTIRATGENVMFWTDKGEYKADEYNYIVRHGSMTTASYMPIDYFDAPSNQEHISVFDGIPKEVIVDGQTGYEDPHISYFDFDNVTSDHTIHIVYDYWDVPVKYNVTGDVPSGYSAPASHTAKAGEVVTLEPTPNIEGYDFSGWNVIANHPYDGESEIPVVNNTFVMPTMLTGSDIRISGSFKRKEYIVTTTGVNAVIDPMNPVVRHGENITINYNPISHGDYRLKEVTVNGNPVDINQNPHSYTFNDARGNQAIHVVYERITDDFKAEGWSGEYDGQNHGVDFTGTLLPDEKVQYLNPETNQWQDTKPEYKDFTNGDKNIPVRVVDKNNESNVIWQKNDNKVNISKRKVEITGNDQTKPYDGTELTASGATAPKGSFVSGEEPILGATGSITLVGTVPSVPTWQFPAGVNANNYEITPVNGTLTITDRTTKFNITVTGNSGNFTYDGTDKTVTGYTVAGLPSGFTVEGVSASGTGKNAGNHAVVVDSTNFVVKDQNGNVVTGQYEITPVNGSINIAQRKVTYTANAASKFFNENDPGFTGSANAASGDIGLVTGESLNVKITRPGAGTDEAVKVYPGAIVATDNGNPNYIITFVNGNFEIKTATATGATIEAPNVNVPYDKQPHGVSASVTGTAVTGWTIEYFDGTNWVANSPTITNVAEGPKTIQIRATKEGYQPLTGSATVTLTAIDAKITVSDAEKEYDGTLNGITLSGNVEGVLAGDSLNEQYSIKPGTPVAEGTYTGALTASYNNTNYDVTVVDAALTIKPKVTVGAAVSAIGGSFTYDGTDHFAQGILSPEAQAAGYTVYYSTDGGANWTTTAPSVKDVNDGEIKFIVEARLDNNATIKGDKEATIKVVAKDVTINANPAEKFYGQNDPAFTGAVAGLVNGNDLGTITYIRTDAGDDTLGKHTGVIAPQYTANPNYNVIPTNGDFTVKVATDANADLQVAGGVFPYDQQAHGVSASVNGSADWLIEYKDAQGNWSTTSPTVTNFSEGTVPVEVRATKYGYAEITKTVNISVSQITATIDVGNASKVYDGNTNITIDMVIGTNITGMFENEKPGNIDYGVVANTNADVGTKNDVINAALDLSQNVIDGNNYIYVINNGDLEITNATDTNAVLTVADESVNYDGNAHGITNATVTNGWTIEYAIAGTNNWSTTAPVITNHNEGPISVDVRATKPNYNPLPTQTVTFGINQIQATINVGNASKVYDGNTNITNDMVVATTVTGMIGSEQLTDINYSIVANTSANVGTHPGAIDATATMPAGNNYIIAVNKGELKITKDQAPYNLALDATSGNKVYDGSEYQLPEATVTPSTPDAKVQYSIDGGNTWLDDAPKGFVNAGSYSVIVKASHNNYDDKQITVSFTVAQRDVDFTVNNITKQYGAPDVYEGGVFEQENGNSGLVSGDTIEMVVNRVGNDEAVGTYNGVLTATNTPANNNYTVNVIPGNLTINKANVPAGASFTASGDEWTYDGTQHNVTAQLTQQAIDNGYKLQYTTNLNDENSWSDTPIGITNVNQGAVTVYVRAISDTHATIAHEVRELKVNAKEVAVNVGSANMVYGETEPTIQAVVEGMVNNETLADVTVERQQGNDVGTYNITATYTANSNYAVTVNDGKLVIGQREVTITGNSASKEYTDGSPLTENGYTIGGMGFVNGEGATVTVSGTISTPGKADNVVTYVLNGNTKAGNYKITVISGVLEITSPATQFTASATGNSGESTYNGQQQTVTGVTINGIQPGHTIEGLSALAQGTTVGNYPAQVVGTPVIRDAFGNDVTNLYNLTITAGNLNIKGQTIYDVNGGTGTVVDNNLYNLGDTVTVSNQAVTRPGAVFLGWSTTRYDTIGNAADEQAARNTIVTTTPMENKGVTLYAVWAIDVNGPTGTPDGTPDYSQFAITYNGNGGTGTVTDGNIYSVGYAVPVVVNGFTNDGFTFALWNVNAAGTGNGYQAGQTVTMVEGGITLYAQWTAVPAAVVTPTPVAPTAPTAPATAPAAPATATVAAPTTPAAPAEVEPQLINDLNLEQLEDGEVPLAGTKLPEDWVRCILHFFIMLAAFIMLCVYTKRSKKHQARIFELREQIADEDLDDK